MSAKMLVISCSTRVSLITNARWIRFAVKKKKNGRVESAQKDEVKSTIKRTELELVLFHAEQETKIKGSMAHEHCEGGKIEPH